MDYCLLLWMRQVTETYHITIFTAAVLGVDWYAICPRRAGLGNYTQKTFVEGVESLGTKNIQILTAFTSLVWSARLWGRFCQYATHPHRAGLGHNGKHTRPNTPRDLNRAIVGFGNTGAFAEPTFEDLAANSQVISIVLMIEWIPEVKLPLGE